MGKEPISDPFHYQEWDYQIQLHRPDWVTIYERRAPKGNPEDIENILTEYKPIAHRIRQIIDLLTPAGVQRQRGMEDGDEVDINAAIDAMIAIRMGEQPNPRITMIRSKYFQYLQDYLWVLRVRKSLPNQGGVIGFDNPILGNEKGRKLALCP
jgi:nitric oxide reductase activation protein